MNRKTWTILLGIVAAGLLSPYVQAQTYDPGPLPTIGDIQTLCVEQYPAPQTRTDVGIGEQVNCWIDTTTWRDTDIENLGESQYNVSDTLGAIAWSVSGPGSIYPAVTNDSSPVTLTIDLVDADDVVTVIAMVRDSGTLGVDPPVQKQKVLNVKIPTGSMVLTATDQPPAAWKPGNANLGAADAFLAQIQPNTVNFNKGKVQIAYAGNPNFVWPDGTKAPIPADVVGPFNPQSVGATPNLISPTASIGLLPVARIAGQNFNYTNAGNLQYQDKGMVWKGVGTFSTLYNFQGMMNPTPPPSAGQTQISASATVGNGNPVAVQGGWQGAWQ